LCQSPVHWPPAWYSTPRLRQLAGPSGGGAAIDGTLRDRLENKADFGQLLEDA
jgi:hypothetical protein